MSLLGETIPIRLFLGGFDLTPTFRDVNKKFSTRYYLNLVLIDEENRRYFKQQVAFSYLKSAGIPLVDRLPYLQEITVFRIPEVRINVGRCFCWSILTISPTRTNGCNFFVCLTLSYRGLCTLRVFPHTKTLVEINGIRVSPANCKRPSALTLITCLLPIVLPDDSSGYR